MWICDISELIKNQENINWNETLKKAERLNIKRILLINLFLAKKFLFDFEIPKEIQYEMDSDISAKKISDR